MTIESIAVGDPEVSVGFVYTERFTTVFSINGIMQGRIMLSFIRKSRKNIDKETNLKNFKQNQVEALKTPVKGEGN